MLRSKLFGAGSSQAGYLTVHRVDPKLVRSPSVGVPRRLIAVLFAGAFVAAVGYGSVQILSADTIIETAVAMFEAGADELPLQAISGFGSE